MVVVLLVVGMMAVAEPLSRSVSRNDLNFWCLNFLILIFPTVSTNGGSLGKVRGFSPILVRTLRLTERNTGPSVGSDAAMMRMLPSAIPRMSRKGIGSVSLLVRAFLLKCRRGKGN